jgi:hypothetical protein
MRKRFIVLAVSLVLLFPAAAFAESFQDAVTFANKDISARYEYRGDFFISRNIKGAGLNQNTWNKPINIGGVSVRTFAYGNPWGDYRNGQYRYLGYTSDGLGFTNINFPCDSKDLLSKYIEDLNWIKYPWNSELVNQALSNMGEGELEENPHFDNLKEPDIRNSALKGLQLEKNENGRALAGSGASGVPWEKYICVYQPPTEYLCGIGRMWNKKTVGGKPYAYYKTVVLMPYSSTRNPVDPPKGTVPGFKGEIGGGGGYW